MDLAGYKFIFQDRRVLRRSCYLNLVIGICGRSRVSSLTMDRCDGYCPSGQVGIFAFERFAFAKTLTRSKWFRASF